MSPLCHSRESGNPDAVPVKPALAEAGDGEPYKKDWIPAGVYPREDGGGNDNLDHMRRKSKVSKIEPVSNPFFHGA